MTEAQLIAWGRRIGRELDRPALLALRGPLGAGKSVLARAIARGAGVDGVVPSPTFNLVLRYPLPGGGELLHFDLYRLEGPDELWELGWSDLGAEGELTIVEWPERAGPLLPEPRWDVDLVPVPGEPELRRVRTEAVAGPSRLPPPPLPGRGA